MSLEAENHRDAKTSHRSPPENIFNHSYSVQLFHVRLTNLQSFLLDSNSLVRSFHSPALIAHPLHPSHLLKPSKRTAQSMMHPYYPPTVDLPHYVPNSRSDLSLVSIIGAVCLAIVVSSWMLLAWLKPAITYKERWLGTWFSLCKSTGATYILHGRCTPVQYCTVVTVYVKCTE